jgi:hypothetical protein
MSKRLLWSTVSVLAIAGCGVAPHTAPGLSSSAAAPVQSLSIRPSTATPPKGAIHTKFATMWITASPAVVRPGERAMLWLNVQGSRPITNGQAQWSCNGGRCDSMFTPLFSFATNGWTAPDQQGGYMVQAFVNVWYQDGTSDFGTPTAYVSVMK